MTAHPRIIKNLYRCVLRTTQELDRYPLLKATSSKPASFGEGKFYKRPMSYTKAAKELFRKQTPQPEIWKQISKVFSELRYFNTHIHDLARVMPDYKEPPNPSSGSNDPSSMVQLEDKLEPGFVLVTHPRFFPRKVVLYINPTTGILLNHPYDFQKGGSVHIRPGGPDSVDYNFVYGYEFPDSVQVLPGLYQISKQNLRKYASGQEFHKDVIIFDGITELLPSTLTNLEDSCWLSVSASLPWLLSNRDNLWTKIMEELKGEYQLWTKIPEFKPPHSRDDFREIIIYPVPIYFPNNV